MGGIGVTPLLCGFELGRGLELLFTQSNGVTFLGQGVVWLKMELGAVKIYSDYFPLR